MTEQAISEVFQAVSVPGNYLADVVKALAGHGHQPSHMFRLIGHTEKDLYEPESRLPSVDYLASLSTLLQHYEHLGLGIEVAHNWRISDHGVLGHAMLCASSGHEALDFWLEFEEITGPIVRLSHSRTDGFVVLTVVECGLSGDVLQYEVENLFAGLTMGVSGVLPISTTKVHFSAPRPENIQPFLDCFDCEVTFNSPRNELWFRESDLDVTPELASPETFKLCKRQCELIRSNLMGEGSLPEQIRKAMLSSKASFPSEEQVADRLGMSTRTLRRRLSEQGVHFREMLNESRVQLAQEYLRTTSLPVARIADIVGYSSIPAFHRAFKHFTGVTPAAYRQSS